jgi:hypothetical protein
MAICRRCSGLLTIVALWRARQARRFSGRRGFFVTLAALVER